MSYQNWLQTDVLIIGCGIAGGTAALRLADAGVAVTVITRAGEPRESNTYYAQGGIIYQGAADTPALLVEDIVRAGAGHTREASARLLAERGPALVEQVLLNRVGVPFDRTEAGDLSLAREGGHTIARIIHATDATGQAIAEAMMTTLAAHPNVTLLSGYTAVDLIMTSQHASNGLSTYRPATCVGAYLLDQTNDVVRGRLARTTILATGGLGQVYKRTTNPVGARGDGVAMAARAGAQVVDLEFVQFHPTTFYHPESRGFLISEAVRGAGARLVNADGQPFMQHYDPEWLDLAPRDIVARSIQAEMTANNVAHVYLDLRSYVSREEILGHFPNIGQYCLGYGVDITRDLVPVAPAAHYACGGVRVDEWGRTDVNGLYAVGEVACTGLHGANRLASTSLLEGLVWGDRAARLIDETLADQLSVEPVELVPYQTPINLPQPDRRQIERYRKAVQDLMWQYVGLVRTTPCLTYALDRLHRLEFDIETFYRRHRPTDNLLGLRNLVQVALLITDAALKNEVSQGCHYRL